MFHLLGNDYFSDLYSALQALGATNIFPLPEHNEPYRLNLSKLVTLLQQFPGGARAQEELTQAIATVRSLGSEAFDLYQQNIHKGITQQAQAMLDILVNSSSARSINLNAQAACFTLDSAALGKLRSHETPLNNILAAANQPTIAIEPGSVPFSSDSILVSITGDALDRLETLAEAR